MVSIYEGGKIGFFARIKRCCSCCSMITVHSNWRNSGTNKKRYLFFVLLWLIFIIQKNWISILYKNGTFFQILEHNIVLLVVVLQRSSFGIHLKSAGEQSKLLSIICLKSACEATIIISLCVVFFLTQAPLNMEAGSEKCCLLLQNLERNIFRVGHKFTKCH